MMTVTLNHLDYPTLAWNMGGGYSAYGQRVAAIALPGGVYFVDYDRMLNYFFPDTPLEKEDIRQAYLHNKGEYLMIDLNGDVGEYQLRTLLEGLAVNVPSIR